MGQRSCAMAVLLVLALAGACGSRATPPGTSFAGDTHAQPDHGRAGTGQAGQALTLDQARAALDQALARGMHRDVIRHAQAAIRLGHALDDAQARGVTAAIDALTARELEALYKELEPTIQPAPRVALRLALLHEHMAGDRAAMKWLERVLDGREVAAADRDMAIALRKRIQARTKVDAAVIAVLLPRSGRFALLGAELEAAIRFAGRTAGRGVKLQIIDTTGDEASALVAVERAVFEHHAIAILGPVGQRESLRASRRAAELGVPIALLAPGEEAAPDAGVFRLWSSPQWEAAEAVRLALAMGYDRLAVLAPQDDHGIVAASAFVAAAGRAGASIVAQGHYDPTATDLEPDIKAFLGLDPAQNARLRQHLRRAGKDGWKTFSPDIAFDLLYIPDEYDRAALVASYMPFFNVEVRSRDVMDVIALRRKHGGRVPQVVQLMGSSGWHHQSVIPRGGTAVDGALILDVYAGGENEEFATEEGARFAEDFQAWAGRPASPLAAQAFDAALLVLQAREQAAAGGQRTGPGLRQAFARALAGARLDAGACGPAQMGPSGTIVREAVLLRIDTDSFVLHEY